MLRQKEGFLSVLPTGNNVFASQFERVLPASSVANLYPLNYSGKTDENGFYIGRDKYGSNVLVDFDKRTEDKTNSNILILGNSGQGKSYLMKLLLCNQREAGKSVLVLDPEAEYRDICSNLGGTYIDMMSGEFMINPLEPKAWSDGEKADIEDPETFRKVTRLSQHISYLKDFFRAYKDFSDSEIDTIEIMLMKLYARFGIDDFTDFNTLDSEDYPIMSDLYELIEKEFMAFDYEKKTSLYRRNAAEYLSWTSLHVQRCGKQVLQWSLQHQGLRVYLFRSERSYGYKQTAERYAAVQHSQLYEQSTARQRKYSCRSRRAVFVSHKYDGD